MAGVLALSGLYDASLVQAVAAKLARLSTSALIARIERAADFGYDDEAVELTERLFRKGSTWRWSQDLRGETIVVENVADLVARCAAVLVTTDGSRALVIDRPGATCARLRAGFVPLAIDAALAHGVPVVTDDNARDADSLPQSVIDATLDAVLSLTDERVAP